MSITDSQWFFVAPGGAGLSCVGAIGQNFRSTIIDELGVGVGVAPPSIIGKVSTFRTDFGIGRWRPLIHAYIGTTFVTANGATLNVALQGAPDSGAGGNYQPGAWQTLTETGPLTAAQLLQSSDGNLQPATTLRLDFAPEFPANLNPRFLSLLFQVQGGGNFTAGVIASAIVAQSFDDPAFQQLPNNFSV